MSPTPLRFAHYASPAPSSRSRLQAPCYPREGLSKPPRRPKPFASILKPSVSSVKPSASSSKSSPPPQALPLPKSSASSPKPSASPRLASLRHHKDASSPPRDPLPRTTTRCTPSLQRPDACARRQAHTPPPTPSLRGSVWRAAPLPWARLRPARSSCLTRRPRLPRHAGQCGVRPSLGRARARALLARAVCGCRACTVVMAPPFCCWNDPHPPPFARAWPTMRGAGAGVGAAQEVCSGCWEQMWGVAADAEGRGADIDRGGRAQAVCAAALFQYYVL
ncbi:hypothetical protein GGX14DRAFT_398740 [Mycena pura]|uniref:Uncharacterized protein n=1 Tax=Mycena pura TaxID=153505 RepID=A0AAD6Y676_9AGAR|nr:hypothetical protein GGX14DRAFT_398740 [Mycena pura]